MLQPQLVLPDSGAERWESPVVQSRWQSYRLGGAVGRVEGRPDAAALSMSWMGLADLGGVSSTHIPSSCATARDEASLLEHRDIHLLIRQRTGRLKLRSGLPSDHHRLSAG